MNPLKGKSCNLNNLTSVIFSSQAKKSLISIFNIRLGTNLVFSYQFILASYLYSLSLNRLQTLNQKIQWAPLTP